MRPGFGNFSMTPDGYVWDSRDFNVRKIDPETGKVVQRYPLQVSFSYDNLISADGKYYGGGGLPAWGNTIERMDLSTGEWIKQTRRAHGDRESAVASIPTTIPGSAAATAP